MNILNNIIGTVKPENMKAKEILSYSKSSEYTKNGSCG